MRTVLLLVILHCSVAVAYCQNTSTDKFCFDVSFWKKELKLSRVQVAQIHQINHGMYDALYELAVNRNTSSDFGVLIRDWRTATMGVLSERQKMKWEKLKTGYLSEAN